MSRRVSLPGADELFRTTGGMALQSSSPASGRRQANGEGPRVPPPAADPDAGAEPREGQERPDGEQSGPGEHSGRESAASRAAGGERRAAAGDH
ncbi:hypothetical protein ABZ566_37060 [Streptomyces hygroscopicus]